MLQNAVKQETSLLAVRRNTQNADGSVIEKFDELVMDEAYEILFKRLMNDAKSDIILNLSSNMIANTTTDIGSSDSNQFTLTLDMHADWPIQYQKTVDNKLQQYLIDYICYRWFETKSQNDAATYYNRLHGTLEDIRRLLVRKKNPLQIQLTLY